MKKPSATLSSEKNWMIKASESIMGPYTLEELAQAVRSKQVGLLDEAKRPQGRWAFVRDLPEMQATVQELANETETIEKTHTAAHTQVSITRRVDDDLTPTPPKTITPIRVTPSVSSPATPVSGATSLNKIETSVRAYGVTTETEPIPLGKWLIRSLVGVSVVVALFAFWQKQSWENKQKKVWSQVQQLFASKLYDRAYDAYKEYQQEVSNQPLALMRLGLLHLNPGHDLVKAKRFFEMSSNLDPKNKELMIQNLNGLALVSLYEGQTQMAKSFLERAQVLEPQNAVTKMNLIAYYMSLSKWSEAMALAQALASLEPRKAHLIQAIVVGISGHFKSELPNILGALRSTADQSLYLRAEMKLMLLSLMSSEQSGDLNSALDYFFTDLPVFSMEFSEDPAVDQRWRDWNYLYQFCSDIKVPESRAADGLAIKIICLSKVQKWTDAEAMLNEGLIRFKSHPKLLLAQLHLLTSMQRWPEARGLSRVAGLQQEESASWYLAKTCLEEGQESCVESYLSPMLQKANVRTFNYILKARQKCRQKSLEGCRFILSQGLAQDPSSTELLSIRYDLEESL